MEKVDGLEMVEEMAKNVGIMMQHKIDAIKVRDLSMKTSSTIRAISTFCRVKSWAVFYTFVEFRG